MIWLKNFVVGKEKQGVDAKKTKRLTGVHVLTKKFTSYKIGYKRKLRSKLDQSTSQLSPLIHGQINAIKSVE